MYRWFHYFSCTHPSNYISAFLLPPPRLSFCSLWSSFWTATMTCWPWTTWRTCWTASRRSSPPSPPGSKRQSTPSGPTCRRSQRPRGSACWRAPLPTRNGQNPTGHGGGGTEDALGWSWTGSGQWVDWAVSHKRKAKTGDLFGRISIHLQRRVSTRRLHPVCYLVTDVVYPLYPMCSELNICIMCPSKYSPGLSGLFLK